jgi:DNA-binding NarL/FixJ family response regulator
MTHDSAPSVHKPNLPGVGLRILIADDFPEWRIQIRKILSSRPEWQVIFEACDGLEALEKAVELRPDVVVLDVGMPVMNGLQAGVKIRERCPGSHIIFVTQTRDLILMEAALEMGAAGFVLKTNVSAELVAVIAGALANGRGHI